MTENVTEVLNHHMVHIPDLDQVAPSRPPEVLPPSPTQHRPVKRMGTLQSATFNIWSTMVGGGSLSLPLAFAKTGNLLMGPILIVVTAIVTEFCFGILIDATYFIGNDQLQPPSVSSSTSTVVAPSETTTAESEPQDRNGGIEEGGQDQAEARISPRDEPHGEEDNSDDYCSNHTLESITAAAAATAVAVNVVDDVNNRTNVDAATSTGTDDESSNHNNNNANMAYSISALLVFFMCFFGIIGYCVLLRDMLLPVTKYIQQQHGWNHHRSIETVGTTFHTSTDTVAKNTNATTVTWANNLSMIIVVVMVTPLCTLQTLTSLQRFSTLSMCSVLILGLCIVYRSVQCHFGYYHNPAHGNNDTTSASFSQGEFDNDSDIRDDANHIGSSGFTWLPQNFKDVLDVIPLYISCYVCHYNIPVVYNDFANPTPTRVRLWLHITVWGATIFYCIIGIAGSSFALACGSNNHIVQGNVLLNFDPDDPLLLVGRLCLAVTIALAFPVLTIPARDIILRYMLSLPSVSAAAIVSEAQNISNGICLAENDRNMLTEPLLRSSSDDDEIAVEDATVHTSNVMLSNNTSGGTVHEVSSSSSSSSSSWVQRLFVSICVLWSGTSIASCVSSIDIVWDFLGSSLSIILSYLVPCGCYIILRRRKDQISNNNDHNNYPTRYRNDDENMIVRQFQSLGNWLPSVSTFCWMIVSYFTPLMFISTANAIYNLLSSQ